MGVLDASRTRPVMCRKRYCGFSTRVRNGTWCRKAIRTTKLCIDAFKLGAATRFCARRWLVERFFAWIQWQRGILVRWEYPLRTLGFVQLACLVVLFRRF
jgi:hypothetical protein